MSIIELLEDFTGVDGLTPDSRLLMDDLERLEFAELLEDEFHINLLDEEIEGWKTVGDIINSIEAK